MVCLLYTAAPAKPGSNYAGLRVYDSGDPTLQISQWRLLLSKLLGWFVGEAFVVEASSCWGSLQAGTSFVPALVKSWPARLFHAAGEVPNKIPTSMPSPSSLEIGFLGKNLSFCLLKSCYL